MRKEDIIDVDIVENGQVVPAPKTSFLWLLKDNVKRSSFAVLKGCLILSNKPIIRRTFFGLNKEWYFKTLLSPALVAGLCLYVLLEASNQSHGRTHYSKESIYYTLVLGIIWALCLLFYPYARYAFDRGFNKIRGDGIYLISLPLLFLGRAIRMLICLMYLYILAPIGLIILYFDNGKSQ